MQDPNQIENSFVHTVMAFSEFLSGGGTTAIIGLLVVAILALVFERNRIIKRSQEVENRAIESNNRELQSVREIIDKYYQGNLNLSTTLLEIKLVLQSIQNTRNN